MKIRRFEVLQTALPFRSAFSHARFSRMHSASVFVRCELEDGTVGFGEGLPREYVTGETWDGCFRCLAEQALPALSDLDFVSHEEMQRFCEGLYGYLRQAAPGMPAHYGAACCAAELALLDAYGKHFGRSVFSGATDSDPVYSGVVSSSSLLKAAAVCWLCRRHDLPAVKLKVGAAHDGRLAWLSRAILGRKASLRADANMAWSADRALEAIRRLQRHGVQWIEQPLAVGNPADWRLLQPARASSPTNRCETKRTRGA